MHLLGKTLRRQNEAIDALCLQQGHPPITQGREAFGSRIGLPLENAGLSIQELTQAECININEYALLMRGVIRGRLMRAITLGAGRGTRSSARVVSGLPASPEQAR